MVCNIQNKQIIILIHLYEHLKDILLVKNLQSYLKYDIRTC